MAGFGDAVPTPVIDGLVSLSSAMLGRDLAQGSGRTLESLGLTGKTVEQIKAIFETGP